MPVAKKHISSWTRRPREVTITPHRIQALLLLTRYGYLSTPYFPALLGGNFSNWQKVLRELFDGGYVDRPKQQRNHQNALYRSRVYAITDAGRKVLRQHGHQVIPWHGSKSFPHELMASELMASFEIGAKEAGVRLITWPEIIPKMPLESRDSAKPYTIPVRYQGETHRITADGMPFGIEKIIDGQKHYFFCPGVEADCDNEGLRTADFERSSIFKKFTLYLEIERNKLYRAHFNFPNMIVPFYTTNATHLENMKGLLHDLTKGAGSRSIIFGKPFAAFTTFEPPVPPSGHALITSYDRVGYDPFYFLS
jgi:hypothetical protein